MILKQHNQQEKRETGMLNNKFRTALTRDEIIGVLLGWLKGPDVLVFPDEMEIGPDEQEALESHAYSVYEDHTNREDDAWESYSLCLESGHPRETCRRAIEDFKRQDEIFKKICDEVDDEISKGERSMLRIDQQSSTVLSTCYTRKSFDEWVTKTPELAGFSRTATKPSARKKTKGELRREAIINCLKEIGHDPQHLKKPEKGRSGIKAEVRERLQTGQDLFPDRQSFDNAWGDLRTEKKIIDSV